MLLAGFISASESLYASELQTVRDSAAFSLHFAPGKDLLVRDYKENYPSLEELKQLIREVGCENITSVKITGSVSGQANAVENRELALKRAQAVRVYIRWQFVAMRREIYELSARPYSYTEADLRNSATCVVFFNRKETPAEQEKNVKTIKGEYDPSVIANIIAQLDSLKQVVAKITGTTAKTPAEPITEPIQETHPQEKTEQQLLPVMLAGERYIRKPLLAVKTNLLFDLASVLNVEVEVPIGKRWSIAGEWIFPWWLWEKEQVCLQVLSGNIEGRYWFGDRSDRPPLTGWFAGLYMGGGLYDLEWKTKGYQGEFFIAAGISAGYAHTLNKSGTFRMEYALGVGYMQTKYREYVPIEGGETLSWQRNGRYSWLGPTRAKVSLIWLINYKSSKGGAK